MKSPKQQGLKKSQNSQKTKINSNYGIDTEIPKGKELIKRENIENTPFTIITIEKEHFATMGKYRITEPTKNKEELIKEIQTITWNRLIQVISIMMEQDKKLITTKNEEK